LIISSSVVCFFGDKGVIVFLMPTLHIFSYITTRTSYFSMRWWWSPLWTKPTRFVGIL